ncbi:DUF3347 domain-containing protein [Deminuibacter soli]|uniref:DUF3347 domain-containing protein n=1 Tax=Deminuibacter soli TaxID=2291815 RepID=A0A3E1NJA6_9BACT|nr:DUF3347 domain-containing protein [Deminuibacter soli]RFM28003.1 DUF3347 domain-containing protein [Deminuibacter soli]
MKKGIWLLLGVVVIAGGAWLLVSKKSGKPAAEAPKQQPLAISKNSAAFNESFGQLLQAYADLKTAFVNWDSVQATQLAPKLAAAANSVKFNELKGDTAIIATAKSLADGLVAETKAIAGEATIEGKRRSFYVLSEDLYNLARAVHYDQGVIYHMSCPMAFNDSEEAFWISTDSTIVNPYLGKKHPHYAGGMIGCGKVQDSIDFRHS